MVFISHSTNGDPAAREVRDRLVDALKQRGWDVQVDEDGLRGGEEWRGVLYEWIADCDAAVVLVTSKAMRSTWVRREINLLLWRRALGSPITILPAYLDITAEQVDQEITELLGVQAVRRQHGQDFADTIARRLPELNRLPDDQVRLWLAEIIGLLTKVEQQELLCAAVHDLDANNDARYATPREWQRLLAHQLLRPGLSARVHMAVGRISSQVGNLDDLIGLLEPVWVNAEAAAVLLPMGKRIHAILNADLPATGRQYVLRAACCARYFHTQEVPAATGEAQHEEFQKNCEDAVRKLLGAHRRFPIDGKSPPDGTVCFLLVDLAQAPLGPVFDVLRTMVDRFPWLNVIILAGEKGLDTGLLAEPTPSDLIVLPPLQSGEEFLASQGVDFLKKLLPLERNR